MEDCFDDISRNPFYKIVFNEKKTPDEKAEAVADALTFNGGLDRKQNLSKIADLKVFKDYLRVERIKLAQELSKFVMSSPAKDTLVGARSVNNGMQIIFSALDKGLAYAGSEAADRMVTAKGGDFAEYFGFLDRLIRETQKTYADHSANAVHLKQIADMPPAKDAEARVKLAQFLKAELNTPAEPAFFFDIALQKPMTVRGALRFRTPAAI